MPLNLSVNGETRVLEPSPDPANLDQVVRALNHNPALVVVECNGVIIPRSRWNDRLIQDGDSLEIVTIVGGGSYSPVNESLM